MPAWFVMLSGAKHLVRPSALLRVTMGKKLAPSCTSVVKVCGGLPAQGTLLKGMMQADAEGWAYGHGFENDR